MLDFIRLCREKNIPYITEGHHHCHEGWVQTHCPFCTDGTYGYHLGFSITGGNFNCWRCGSHSPYKYLTFIFKNQNVSIKQIYRQYSTKTASPTIKVAKVRKRKAKQPPNMLPFIPRMHMNYLNKRGFNYKKLEKEWNLGGTENLSGRWNWRIIAPIRNKDNNIVAYAGRALHPDVRPRWKFSKNENMVEDPKKMIYGIEKIPNNRVVIVEGVSDVWRLGPGSVATFGIDWKEEQAAILKNYHYRFIMFDPEPQAQKQAKKLANWLAPFPGETELLVDLKTDPGDMEQKVADKIMEELGF